MVVGPIVVCTYLTCSISLILSLCASHVNFYPSKSNEYAIIYAIISLLILIIQLLLNKKMAHIQIGRAFIINAFSFIYHIYMVVIVVRTIIDRLPLTFSNSSNLTREISEDFLGLYIRWLISNFVYIGALCTNLSNVTKEIFLIHTIEKELTKRNKMV